MRNTMLRRYTCTDLPLAKSYWLRMRQGFLRDHGLKENTGFNRIAYMLTNITNMKCVLDVVTDITTC